MKTPWMVIRDDAVPDSKDLQVTPLPHLPGPIGQGRPELVGQFGGTAAGLGDERLLPARLRLARDRQGLDGEGCRRARSYDDCCQPDRDGHADQARVRLQPGPHRTPMPYCTLRYGFKSGRGLPCDPTPASNTPLCVHAAVLRGQCVGCPAGLPRRNGRLRRPGRWRPNRSLQRPVGQWSENPRRALRQPLRSGVDGASGPLICAVARARVSQGAHPPRPARGPAKRGPSGSAAEPQNGHPTSLSAAAADTPNRRALLASSTRSRGLGFRRGRPAGNAHGLRRRTRAPIAGPPPSSRSGERQSA